MEDTAYYVEHVVFAVLREFDAETSTALLSLNASPQCRMCTSCVMTDRNQQINNEQLGQTLRGDAVWVTIFGQVMRL